MRVLLTGASGFVGSHLVRHLLVNTDWELVAPVSFRHKGLAARIESSVCDVPGGAERVRLLHWDLTTPADHLVMRELEGCEVILNVASESHVDRSIEWPNQFISNNVSLVLNVLEVARHLQPRLVLQMSTDEVYGPAYGSHRHAEWETIAPSNPYSASKAAQEAICFSYWRTYDLPIVITNTMNILGEMQDPEKFLPLIIRNVLAGKPTTVHCDPDGTAGSRFYLHARNLADAWLYLTRRVLSAEGGWFDSGYSAPDGYGVESVRYSLGGDRPMRFNVVGEHEVYNDVLVRTVANMMGGEYGQDDDSLIERVSFHASRPGHDLRYALDGSKLKALGWKPPVPYLPALRRTVEWYLAHPEWLEL